MYLYNNYIRSAVTISGIWAGLKFVVFDISLNSTVELSYLIDEAPFENLKSGNKFKLYEGAS